MNEDRYLVLVYGTLMSGGGLNYYLQGETTKFIAEVTFKGGLYDIGQNFPALSFGNNSYKGEVYEVDYMTLRTMDAVEGYNSVMDMGMYMRRQIKVDINGEDTLCYVYLWSYQIDKTDILFPSGIKWSEKLQTYMRKHRRK